MQAEHMVKRSKRIFAPVHVGENVTIPIPQGRNDPRHIIGAVTERSDNYMYNIVVKSSTLSGKYSRHQIDVYATKLYYTDDFNTGKKPFLSAKLFNMNLTVVGRVLPSATVQVPSVVKLIVSGVAKPRCSSTLGVTQHCVSK